MVVATGCVEVATASIGAKGAIGKANDSMVVTKRHDGVRTMARCVAELWRAHGYGKLGQCEGFALNHLHGKVCGVKAKLDGQISSRRVVGVGHEGHGTTTA